MNHDILQKKLKEQNGDGRPKRTATLAHGVPPRNSLPCLGRKERTDWEEPSGEFEDPLNPE
jgi:hypothetical protein